MLEEDSLKFDQMNWMQEIVIVKVHNKIVNVCDNS